MEVKTILETYLGMMTAPLSFSIMIPSPVWNPEILQLIKANTLIFSFRDLLSQSSLTRYEANKNLKISLRMFRIKTSTCLEHNHRIYYLLQLVCYNYVYRCLSLHLD